MSDSTLGSASTSSRLWRQRFNVVPTYVLMFAIGLGFGLVWRLPFFPWMLSDRASTVLGAAVGALVGAAGAAVIAVNITTRSDRKGREDVLEVLERVMTAIEKASCINDGKPRETIEAVKIYNPLSSALSIATCRLKFLENSTRHVQAACLAICDASLALGRFEGQINKELADAKSTVVDAIKKGKSKRIPYEPPSSFKAKFTAVSSALTVVTSRLDRGIVLEPRRKRAKEARHDESLGGLGSNEFKA